MLLGSYTSLLPHAVRDTVIGYLDVYANSTLATVTIDSTGVGEYDGRGRIPAHHFFSLEGAGAKGHDDSGAFAVHGIDSTTRLAYPHIRGVPHTADVVLRVATTASGLAVSVRLGGMSGPEACRASLPVTGGLDAWVDVRCVVAQPRRQRSLLCSSLRQTRFRRRREAPLSSLVWKLASA